MVHKECYFQQEGDRTQTTRAIRFIFDICILKSLFVIYRPTGWETRSPDLTALDPFSGVF